MTTALHKPNAETNNLRSAALRNPAVAGRSQSAIWCSRTDPSAAIHVVGRMPDDVRLGAACGEPAQVSRGQVRAQGLDPSAAGGQVDQVAVSPEPDHRPRPGGTEPELLAGHLKVPRRGNDQVELDRPALPASPGR